MRILSIILLLLCFKQLQAQQLSGQDLTVIKKQEDSLKNLGIKMINEKTAVQRFLADSAFIKILVRALKKPYSFYYPFDSLQNISRFYAPDTSFRIFSWQFTRDEDYSRQRGAIQMRTADGSLKLFPLVDMSDFTTAPQDSIRTGKNWIGCIYYSIVMKLYNGKKYYTLLGYDENNMRSTKKWIEVLHFDDNGNPQFGGPFFSIPTGDVKARGTGKQARFVMEYKKDGKARMNYDKELDMIVFDHLVPEDGKSDKAYTFIPDGDYMGFKWLNGKWVQVDKIFNQSLEDGQAPVPKPLKDSDGKNNEQILMQQSEKNRLLIKQEKTPPAKKPTPTKREEKKPSKESEESY